MSWAVPLTRLLCLTSIVALTCTACLAHQDSVISPSISTRRHLLNVQDDPNKAEQAECNAVKYLPKGSSECEYVKENCAKGATVCSMHSLSTEFDSYTLINNEQL